MQLRRPAAHRKQAGDTLIEVLLAFTVFGLAVTVALSTMNEGSAKLLVSGQRSQVQALMNGQITLLRAAHSLRVSDPSSVEWPAIIAVVNSSGSASAAVDSDGCTQTANKPKMYFDATTTGANWLNAVRIPGVITYPTEGIPVVGQAIWIEPQYVDPGTAGRPYYDFYVKACWYSAGQQQVKSVVRLYEISN